MARLRLPRIALPPGQRPAGVRARGSGFLGLAAADPDQGQLKFVKLFQGAEGNGMRNSMRWIETLEDIREERPCALALGSFDGLHRGHMAVIRAARQWPWEAGAFTFPSSPAGGSGVVTPRDKRRLLEAAGLKRVYSIPFAQVRDIEAEDFVRRIFGREMPGQGLCAAGRISGLAGGAAGDVALLTRLCGELGLELRVVPPVLEGGREGELHPHPGGRVEAGDIPLANRLLGRPLWLLPGGHPRTTTSAPGWARPPSTRHCLRALCCPGLGVYASWVRIDGRYYYGVTNIGVKPTVGSDRVLAETWMPEFSGDLYDKRVRVFLVAFIRPERKFGSLEELKEEIGRNRPAGQGAGGGRAPWRAREEVIGNREPPPTRHKFLPCREFRGCETSAE